MIHGREAAEPLGQPSISISTVRPSTVTLRPLPLARGHSGISGQCKPASA
jgi:hypothetical protein